MGNVVEIKSGPGRPRAPKAVRQARGSRGADRDRTDPFGRLPLPAEPPEYLGPLAAECWRTIAATQQELASRGLAWISVADSFRVETACYAYERWRESARALEASIADAKALAFANTRAALVAAIRGTGKHTRKLKLRATLKAKKEAARASGTMVVGKDGVWVVSPYVTAELQQRAACDRAFKALGMAPGVRMAIAALDKAGSPPEDAGDEDFIAR